MSNIFDLFRKIERERADVAPITHLVVGLGNPGEKYTFTRHNAGFLALDEIASRIGARIDRAKFDALVGEGKIGTHRVLLLKPQTFMNLSGKAVRAAADFYRIEPSRIIVLCDDITGDVARLRVRGKGSAGGHNGLRSIIEHLGTDAFPRVRIGVGDRPDPRFDLADFVLSEFTHAEREALAAKADTVMAGVVALVEGDLDRAQRTCNQKC